MTEEIIDWDYQSDESIRPGSIELQRVAHREWHEKIKSRPVEDWMKAKPFWRVKSIEKLEVRLGRSIYGEVLEIGAGTALCSAQAAKRDHVERVTAMDIDRFCVEEMMSTVFEKFEAPQHKIRRAIGSYNVIPEKAFYDFVIGVGALHHAENLRAAFDEVYSALKPGGIFLVSDMCEFDQFSNASLNKRYESVSPVSEERYGRAVKMKDNGDHWYRFSEWLSSARAAGFEALPYLFDADLGEEADDSIFANPQLWRGFQVRVFKPYFADRLLCDSLVLILQKPLEDGSAPAIPENLAVEGTPTQMTKRASPKAQSAGSSPDRLKAVEEELQKSRERAAHLKDLLTKTEAKLANARSASSSVDGSLLRRLFRKLRG